MSDEEVNGLSDAKVKGLNEEELKYFKLKIQAEDIYEKLRMFSRRYGYSGERCYLFSFDTFSRTYGFWFHGFKAGKGRPPFYITTYVPGFVADFSYLFNGKKKVVFSTAMLRKKDFRVAKPLPRSTFDQILKLLSYLQKSYGSFFVEVDL
ncbi:MAG: hypothetical protein ACPLZG_13385 [Thermoproteota archaeon]